jgi:DNA-binding CsgD family transcriptional regulator
VKIERHRADTGGMTLGSSTGRWTYSDPAVHRAALRLFLKCGINAATIDDWIEAEAWEDGEQLRRVLGWRGRMLSANSIDAAEGWGMFLLTLRDLKRREAFLHPFALVGKQLEGKLPAPGERKTIRMPQKTALQVKARDKRIVELSKAGKSSSEIGLIVKLSRRQVRRIVKLHTA